MPLNPAVDGRDNLNQLMGSLSHYFQAKKYMSGGVGSPSINSMEDNLNEALFRLNDARYDPFVVRYRTSECFKSEVQIQESW